MKTCEIWRTLHDVIAKILNFSGNLDYLNLPLRLHAAK
jgi:hypothetical protein